MSAPLANSAILPGVKLRSTLVLLACATALASCGGEESPSAVSEPTTATAPPTETALPEPSDEPRPQAPEKPEPEPPAKPSKAEKQSAADGAAGAYTDYIGAIEARDGEALCSLLPPGFERELKPPLERGDCAATMEASIGYEDPRGFPVWTGTTLNAIQRLAIGADRSTVRLTAMIVTDFEGREPSSRATSPISSGSAAIGVSRSRREPCTGRSATRSHRRR